MTTETFAVIEIESGNLVNSVVCEEGSGWAPPVGTRVVLENDISTHQWEFDEQAWAWNLLLVPGVLIIGSVVDAQNHATPPGVDPNNPPPIPPHPSTDQPVAEGVQSL